MKKKNKITKEDIHKMEQHIVRESQKKQGFFDGRFVQRSEKDKTKYSRKTKHKNKSDE
jgi:hypothetical protein